MSISRLSAELVCASGDKLGEGPFWDPAGERLLWVDIDAPAMREYRPATGQARSVPVDKPLSAVLLRASGGLLGVVPDGFAGLDEVTGELSMLSALPDEPAGNRMNDAACDPAGRLWAGSMPLDLSTPSGMLYRLDPDLIVHPVLAQVTISNGLGWSPDGRLMYYIDSRTQRVDVFDYDLDTGTPRNRRPFVSVPAPEGLPDGLTVDAEGGIWVVLNGSGAVRRYSPDGTLIAVVRVPVRGVTSCCFGGTSLDRLYITSSASLEPAGADRAEGEAAAGEVAGDGSNGGGGRPSRSPGGLFQVDPGTAGLPSIPFAG